MQERVSLRIGKNPVIIVAPHGPDDIHTDVIAEELSKQLDCYAVINRGFERSDTVDVNNDQANCNHVPHIITDVVKDEFLKPLLKFRTRIKYKLRGPMGQFRWGSFDNSKCLIFYIHGAGNIIHKQANEEVGIVIGYGLGTKKDSLTCELWRKNLFVDTFRNFSNDGDCFEGRGNGKFAGRSSNNLNQYFKKHDLDPWVDCMQLETPFCHRKTKSRAVMHAILLSTVIKNVMNETSYLGQPSPKFI